MCFEVSPWGGKLNLPVVEFLFLVVKSAYPGMKGSE